MTDSSPLRIGVFGAGATGLYLAGRLARAGYQVTLIVRPGPRFPLPVIIEENGRNEACEGITVSAAWDAVVQDLLVVAVKAHQLPAALPDMAAWAGSNTQFLMIQNGLWGTIRSQDVRQRVLSGMSFPCSQSVNDLELIRSHQTLSQDELIILDRAIHYGLILSVALLLSCGGLWFALE